MSETKYERNTLQILPINKVVGVLETQEAVDAVISSAKEAGFKDTDVLIHHGESGKEYIDPDGSHRGIVAQWVRSYQRLSGPEKRMLDMSESALEAGKYLVGIQTNGSEEMRDSARDVIAPHTKSPMYFCGKFTITVLG